MSILQRLRSGLHSQPGKATATLTPAAVLIAVINPLEQAEVLLTRRASHMRLHAGEVAFPGGKCDPDDRDPWDTALRESWEEVQLQGHKVSPLGFLPKVITRTGIEIVPCVAQLEDARELVANPEELDAVFTVPLDFLARRHNLRLDEVDYYGQLRKLPHYQYGEYSIWGVTAFLLVQLVNLACDAGLELNNYWMGNDHEILSGR